MSCVFLIFYIEVLCFYVNLYVMNIVNLKYMRIRKFIRKGYFSGCLIIWRKNVNNYGVLSLFIFLKYFLVLCMKYVKRN